MKNSVYHKLLRIGSLSLALVLVFQSGLLSPITRELSRETGLYLANAIGINAAVLPTEINTLSAQLEQKNTELKQREIAVNLKEAQQSTSEMSTFILSILLFVLLVLIILNYVLDFIRSRKVVTVPIQNEKAA